MAKSFVQRVAEENAQLKNQLRNVSASSRLANASLEDEPLDSFDVEGNLKATFGRQPDGSHGGLVRDSGPQPTLTAPDLTAKELGALAVVWDGKTTDFDLPLVHGHTEILYARSEDGTEPALSEYRKAPSTIRDRDGGGTTIVCSPAGTWYVRLQLVGQDRVTKGEPSEATSVEIEAKVDRQEIIDKLDEGEKLIEAAREDLALGEEERAQKIAELVTRQEALNSDLSTVRKEASSKLEDLDTTLRGAFTTQLDGVLEALQGAGRTWSQDTAPPRGTTYEWAGAPHASESIKKVDGAEVARNLATNPSFELSDTSSMRFPGTFNHAQSPDSVHGDYSLYVRVNQDTSAYGSNRFVQEIAAAPLTWVAFRVDFISGGLSGSSEQPSFSLRFRTRGAGAWTDSPFYSAKVEPGGGPAVFAAQVPAGHTELEVMVYPYGAENGDALTENNWWRTDGWHVATASTEADALTQVEAYFDGDTLDDRQNDLWINSNGTQHRWDDATKQWVAFTNEQLQQSVDQALAKSDTALTMAGTKNTTYTGTTDPEFDGIVAGDQYRKVDESDADKAKAKWIWNGAQWVSDPVTSEVIDHLDVHKLTASGVTTPVAVIEKLMADGITARTATLARAVVSAQNLIPDPLFEDFDWWNGLQTSWIATSQAEGRSFRISQSEIDAAGGYLPLYTARYEAKPGVQYSVTFKANRFLAVNPGNDDYRVWVRFNDAALGYVANTAQQQNFAADGWNEYTFTFEVPDNPDIAFWELGWTANTLDGGYLWVAKPRVNNTLDGRLIVDGLLQAAAGVLEELFFDTAVGDAVWAQSVRSRLVQSVGIITETMVGTESVTTPKLKVTEDMVAKFAQILHLVADQVEMNNFIAGSGMVGLLEAIGLTLSDEAGGRRTEVSGAGISVIDTATGTPEIQLGTFSDDLLTLRDRETGDVSLSMSNEGSLSAVQVSSAQDLNVAGKSLMGGMFNSPQSAATTSVLDALGWGASRVLVRQFTSAISGPSMRGIAHIEAKVVPGRIYRISCADFQMGDRQDYYMIGNYTTSSSRDSRPATPTSNSPTLGTVPGRVPPSGYGWPTTSMSFEKIYTPTTEEWIRVLFSVGRFSGAGDLVTFNGSNSIATNPRFLIEDLGPRVGDGGVTTWRDPGSTTGFSEAPDIVTQPYPVAETATYTWNPSTGAATRQGINVEPRFGYWPNGLYYLTWVRFNNWTQGGAFYNADVSATPKRWATSAGQVVQSSLLTGATTGTPPTSFNTSIVDRLPDLTGVGAGATRMLPLSPDRAEALAGMYRGLALFGWSGWTGSNLNNAAAGVLNLDKTFARLHTTTATNDG